ncbi:3-keto-5-aminohexanoate cleavage protein [Rhodovibrionaceae bacterium A322]
MALPCIITVAITGSVPKKADCPGVPVSVNEQIDSTQEAFEAGASLVHIHVRDEAERPSSDPDKFGAVKEGIDKHCPGMIVQFSTGARGRKLEDRGGMLFHRPDMASLATGSVNFPTFVNENPPQFIRDLAGQMQGLQIKPECEIFDLAMLYNVADLVAEGLLCESPHVQFVMGIKGAQPARREILEFELSELKKLLPKATWTAAGLGRHQLDVNNWALELGGHCRTGLEDNIRFDKSRLAKSNAELVSRVAELCQTYGRRPATAAEARDILGLRPAA